VGCGSEPLDQWASIATASCAAAEAFALDLAAVRVNAVQPGLSDTLLLDTFGARRLACRRRSKYLATNASEWAQEVADAIALLMKNGFVTGTRLTIDGGAVPTWTARERETDRIWVNYV
jgi:NAD(P)-dependent dehydrogenase (short-subunit alcohol dehydrogenase family)